MKITTIGLDITPTVGALGEICFSFACMDAGKGDLSGAKITFMRLTSRGGL